MLPKACRIILIYIILSCIITTTMGCTTNKIIVNPPMTLMDYNNMISKQMFIDHDALCYPRTDMYSCLPISSLD